MAKDIWQSLLITHQGNSQVKDNKIDLLVQQYEQFTILEEESIDSGFARFNTIITSLKALDEGFSSKNYVRKFLRALHPKWRAKVTAIEESFFFGLGSAVLTVIFGPSVFGIVWLIEGNSQVKDNNIDLLVQQYEQFIILEEESIDSGFARFNTIITSLKDPDEGFSSKNYLRKFLRDLHPKWREKVTAIEESKDFSSLALDELIGNLKVHEVVMEKDSIIYRGKKERIKSIALKTKKESSNDETSTSGSNDKEYVMAVRNFKKIFRRKGKFFRQPREEKKSFRQRDEKKGKSDQKCFRWGDPNHLIGDCPKPSRNKDQKTFIGGSWSDNENDVEDKTNDETCLMAQSSNEIACKSCEELKLENVKLKETQVKFDKFDKSANSLREMLNNQKLSNCKVGLGFDCGKASTSRTKTMSFVGSSAEKAMDGSTIKVAQILEINMLKGSTQRLSEIHRVRMSGAQGCKAWRPNCIAWSGGQGWWSGGQDVRVVPKGVA
ncbi:hypothetical protein Tco_0059200 [Tanacetum coccineum]